MTERKLIKQEYFLIAIICLLTFMLVYSPHLSYKWPLHIDEWHHITEAIKLRQGTYERNWQGVEFGFHIFLAGFSYIIDLVKNYQYFAAIWAVISALTLFYVVYKKTKEFETSLFAMIFFASIKSNVNLLGLWFFTPLTFAIPFIFLYIYLFTEGIQRENKKYLLISLAIMLFIIITHSVSLLFAIPFLTIYCAINYKKAIKQWKTLCLFLIIPIFGIFFGSYLMNTSFTMGLNKLIEFLQFNHGWGVSELENSPLEIYSSLGYLFAIIGAILIMVKKQSKEYLAYLLWPLSVLAMILVFRLSETSYLSPYQRNVYYFAISLPILSAIGLNEAIQWIDHNIDKISLSVQKKDLIKGTIMIGTIFSLLTLIFISYFSIPEGLKPYAVADDGGFEALKFLATQEKGNVMAPLALSTAVFPISGQNQVASIFFYGDRTIVENFFSAKDCQQQKDIAQENNITYILESQNKTELECDWNKIYYEGNYTIYKT